MTAPGVDVSAESENGRIAFVGGGPAGFVTAIALARRGIPTTIFERDPHPAHVPRFNPDRSYTIDISGHGLRALRHIDACAYFDEGMLRFKGLKTSDGTTSEWPLPGWTGSRGDIMRALVWLAESQYGPLISTHWETRVRAVDVLSGAVAVESPDGAPESFDLVVGADGAGSVVRDALRAQVPGFTVTTGSYPNYCTMIELDQVGDGMDRHYLHGLSARPFCVAGAIKGDPGSETPRWFCAVGTRTERKYATADEARRFFQRHCPRVLALASDGKVEAFAKRPCYHIGRTLACSQLHGGKAVLIGDAAAAFPPIGQGVNAAMESAMVFDRAIGERGASPAQLLDAARAYSDDWKPEADAVAWMSVRSLFENRLHMLRAMMTARMGISIFDEAKSAEIPYSAVKRDAEKRWPLWA